MATVLVTRGRWSPTSRYCSHNSTLLSRLTGVLLEAPCPAAVFHGVLAASQFSSPRGESTSHFGQGAWKIRPRRQYLPLSGFPARGEGSWCRCAGSGQPTPPQECAHRELEGASTLSLAGQWREGGEGRGASSCKHLKSCLRRLTTRTLTLSISLHNRSPVSILQWLG